MVKRDWVELPDSREITIGFFKSNIGNIALLSHLSNTYGINLDTDDEGKLVVFYDRKTYNYVKLMDNGRAYIKLIPINGGKTIYITQIISKEIIEVKDSLSNILAVLDFRGFQEYFEFDD